MTFGANRTRPCGVAAGIEIAGEHAVCDPRGALFFPQLSMLTVSDLHLEKGAAFARRGSFVPPYDTAVTLAQLGAVIADYEPDIVVSLGDSFHDGRGAGLMPRVYRDRLLAMMDKRDWFWISGNHDPEPPVGLPGRCVTELAVARLVLRHEPRRAAASGEIAGHLHPGARIVRQGRSVRRACFATDGERLIMPAFGSLTGTLNVLDRAYSGLFSSERLMAYMLGRSRVYPIAGSMLAAA